jgi:hypothetical protein
VETRHWWLASRDGGSSLASGGGGSSPASGGEGSSPMAGGRPAEDAPSPRGDVALGAGMRSSEARASGTEGYASLLLG